MTDGASKPQQRIQTVEDAHKLIELLDALDEADRARVWNAIRGRALSEIDDHVKTRILDDGEPVTNNAAGTRIGFETESYADILNFKGGSVTINDRANGRQFDITGGGGGADCMFDYLVSGCFSTLAGFTEGQTFTSLSGCTFKGYSTVQGAVTDIALQANGTDWVVALCGITTEDVTVPAMASGPDNIYFYGAGTTMAGIAGAAVAEPVLTITQGAPALHFNNLMISGSGSNTLLVSEGQSCVTRWVNCDFFNSTGTGTVGVASSQQNARAEFIGCHFDKANILAAGTATWDGLLVSGGCHFATSNINLSSSQAQTDVVITGNHFDGDNDTITIARFSKAVITGNEWQANSTTTAITVGGGGTSTGCTITGNTFGGSSTSLPSIKITGASAICYQITIAGNTFSNTADSNPYIVATGTDVRAVTVVGNTFGGIGAGLALTAIIGVSGTFYNSTFGPNAPGMRVQYTVTGTQNDFDSVTVDAGAPTVNAHEGKLYFDSTANTLYINTDGGTTWAVYGAVGGGAAAPADADYLVGTANGTLTNEIVVGTTPGGELGGTWASPTVDATHSGTPHSDYVPLASANYVDLTDGGATTLHSHAGGGSVATDAIWDAAGDIAVGTGADTAAKLAYPSPDVTAQTTATSQWNNQTGNARKVLTVDEAGALVWANLTAIDILTPAQVLTFNVSGDGTGDDTLDSSDQKLWGSDAGTWDFSMTYQGTPTAATIDSSRDDAADYPVTVLTPFASYLNAPAITSPVAVNSTITFTLSATVDGQSKQKTVVVTFRNRKHWGLNTDTDLTTSAEVNGLSTEELMNAKGRSFTVSPSAQYLWYCYPSRLGTVTFTIDSFPAAFDLIRTLSHTNDASETEDYYCYRSTNLLTGTNLAVVAT